MALTLEQKKLVVAQVADVARQAHSAVAAEYRGLNVADMTRLRNQAREAGVYVQVVRNTLARRAVAATPYACMDESLIGPLVLAALGIYGHDHRVDDGESNWRSLG